MLAAGPLSFVPSLALVPALSAGWECAKSTMSDWDIDPNPDNGYNGSIGYEEDAPRGPGFDRSLLATGAPRRVLG